MNRVEFLDQVKEVITKERTGHYGEPQNCFDSIAAYWTQYLSSIMYRFPNGTVQLSGTDVTMMMSLLKIARQAVSPEYLDNYTDLAGYAACAAEVQLNRKN